MNSTINRASILAKITLILSLVSIISIFLMNGTLGTSTAQSEERMFDDKVPKHLPIKVNIKKEKEQSFKDLKNEKWFQDLEIEVTNTGSKPIYYLALVLEMPEMISETGRVLGYPLIYGRRELVDLTAKVLSDDAPLAPGETYTFKIPDKWAKGFEHAKTRDNKPDPKRLQIRFQVINFGDGTGFIGTDGISVPQPKKSCLEEKIPRDNEQRASVLPEPSRPSFTSLNHSILGSPAKILQVNFSLASDNVVS